MPTDARTPQANPALSESGITSIGLKTYVTAFIVLIALMLTAFILTQTLPAGEFDRLLVDGREEVVPGSYHAVTGDLPLWKWAVSPFLILAGPNNVILIMLLIFLFCIGGAFYALEKCGVLTHLIARIAQRFQSNNRVLLFLLPFVFMSMGSLIGSFEETIPLAAIVVALALRLGWDKALGLEMSLLAAGCGFAVGVMNPFTVGIAQTISGLQIFSGVGMRIVSFVVVYALLMLFLLYSARRCERKSGKAAAGKVATPKELQNAPLHETEGVAGAKLDRALKVFATILISGIALIIACSVVPIEGLSDLVFPVTALTFLLCGLIAPPLAGASARELGGWFLSGVKVIAPSALLVLMASSISFMLTEGKVLDTIIFYAGGFLSDKPGWLAIMGIYLLVLLLEFAIPSGSAKAFLLMPLLAPLVDMLEISRQVSVLAYAFGDGFTNVFYPTNPALLIALSICGLSYGQWIRRTWPFLLALLLATSTLLIIALSTGYH